MLFHTYQFLFFFLPVTVFGYFFFARISRKFAVFWLVVASLFFYAWWNPYYISLLLASAIFNYLCARRIEIARKSGNSKKILILAILTNLIALCYFKYIDFFISTTNSLFSTNWPVLHVILPLGISFFTFTQIAFLIDTSRGTIQNFRFNYYLLFVTYFPHLIAGPVLHHNQIFPQLEVKETYKPDIKKIEHGLSIFLIGLIKKVILADNLGVFADPVFLAAKSGQTITFLDGWLGALCYTFQLYFDFSGYSDMAIGVSLLFGISLPINFNSPYRSRSIIEFWGKWHITLSQFLRNYLYFPLGGNRSGSFRRYINIFLTMLLGGLWHGASWNLVLWGGLHGIYLAINHLWRNLVGRHQIKLSPRGSQIINYFFGLITFISVVVAWIIFRAETFGAAVEILSGMAGINGVVLLDQIVALFPYMQPYVKTAGQMMTLGAGSVMGCVEQLSLIMLSAFVCFFFPNTQQMTSRSKFWVTLFSAGFLIQSIFFSRVKSDFIYFQF